MSNAKTCYIIGPIGKPDTPVRAWADFVREHIIKPVLTDCGYAEPARADDPEKELIMLDIIAQMFNADLVVADLTDYNPNVFYELGIRHCAKKPVIHLIKDDQKPPFDLGGNKAIFISRDYEKVIAAVSDIGERIKVIEKNSEQFYSQVQVHIQMNQLELFKESKTGFEQSIVEGMATLLRLGTTHTETLKQLYEEIITRHQLLKEGSYMQRVLSGIEPISQIGGHYPGGFSITEALGLSEKKEQKEADT